MTKIEVELHEDVLSVLNKLKNIQDTGIELVVPEGAVLFENIINLKLIKKWSDKESKVINFNTEDINGQNMLTYLENGGEPDALGLEEDESDTEALEEYVTKKKLSMPKIKLSFPKFKSTALIIIFVLLALLGVGGFFGYRYMSMRPKADISVSVNSQPLTRSIEIKVKNGAETSAEEKVLKGTTIEATLEEELSKETTGEKTIGEKAEGVVVIFNKTEEEQEFDDGTVLIFEDDDDNEYKYVTKDDVTVPPREEAADSTPAEPKYISGSAEVDVEAEKIGKKYNLDDGEDLKLEDEDTNDFEAEVKEDIDGGVEEEISIVSQEDLDTLKDQLAENSEEKVLRALEEKISREQKLVKGSQTVAITKEEYSHALEDETEEVTLKQTFVAKGLVYESDTLNNLLEELVEDFVPEGFILSTKERVVNVEILGNTETTILNETEADLQVTLKTFVIPDISEESIKNEIMGKSVSDAQKIIGSIRNIKSYSLNVDPSYPFFDKIPNDKDRIKISVERE